MPQALTRANSWLSRHPVVLFALLYAAIAALAALAHALAPAVIADAIASLTNGQGLGIASGNFGRDASRLPAPASLWAIAAVAMTAAGLLSLPVAWLYTITRKKGGYRQSVVQTLVLLPLVVAGVVVLVKFSLALAFSLAGIVAAVRFRNTLEDSKDAVFIFVATGVGLASGVELSVAATLSFVFNAATLILFVADFGRTPARLEGEMAEERLQRAIRVADRKSQFVAAIDREILEDMAPQQLEALAERAWKRRQDATDTGEMRASLERILRLRVTDPVRARAAIELVLDRNTKRFQLQLSEPEDGGHLLEYAIRLRRSTNPTALLVALRAEHDSGVQSAELVS